jgi:Shikimate 5'-dehydrogenase C-terminal domain
LEALGALDNYDVLVNATSIGFDTEETPVAGEMIKRGLVVLDAVFAPTFTTFLKAAQSRGCQVVRGYRLFIHQALFQFELFTGPKPPFAVMEKALLAAVAASMWRRPRTGGEPCSRLVLHMKSSLLVRCLFVFGFLAGALHAAVGQVSALNRAELVKVDAILVKNLKGKPTIKSGENEELDDGWKITCVADVGAGGEFVLVLNSEKSMTLGTLVSQKPSAATTMPKKC